MGGGIGRSQKCHRHHGRQGGWCGEIYFTRSKPQGNYFNKKNIANSASIPKNCRKNDKKTYYLGKKRGKNKEIFRWKILDFKPALWYIISCKGINHLAGFSFAHSKKGQPLSLYFFCCEYHSPFFLSRMFRRQPHRRRAYTLIITK